MAITPIAPLPGPAAASPAVGARFGPLLEARLRPAYLPSPPTLGAPLAGALRGVEAAQARLDAILAAARQGQTFSAGQLLALQADAYRLSQTLDVAAKVVEQGVQAVKQAVQTQV